MPFIELNLGFFVIHVNECKCEEYYVAMKQGDKQLLCLYIIIFCNLGTWLTATGRWDNNNYKSRQFCDVIAGVQVISHC